MEKNSKETQSDSTDVFDVEKFVTKYEEYIETGDNYQASQCEEVILDGIMTVPNKVAPLYRRLASSTDLDVVMIAAYGISVAFKCDPEIGANTWNHLLNSRSISVAEAAYRSFDEFCGAIEKGIEHPHDLQKIYQNFIGH